MDEAASTAIRTLRRFGATADNPIVMDEVGRVFLGPCESFL
jgi:hypothetical protein